MKRRPPLSLEQLSVVRVITERLRAKAGLRADAVQPEVVWRAAASHLKEAPADENDPQLEKVLRDAMLISDTYFFRHPEHFLVVSDWGQRRLLDGQTHFRAWSAGCSTGEEAFSLAASLLSLGVRAKVEVLGTDLNDHSLHRARQGRYASWSRRVAGPLLFPTGRHHGAGSAALFQVHPEVSSRARFMSHNLLNPLAEAEGSFDVILCRNVLMYLEDSSARSICQNLADRLRPGGILILSQLDTQHAPPELTRVSYGDVEVLQHPVPEREVAPKWGAARAAMRHGEQPWSQVGSASAPIAKHIQALVHLERGRHREAKRLLTELEQHSPEYLPAVLEDALLSGRRGDHAYARQRMKELLAKLEGRPADQLLPGPEELPVAFYRASAEAFLKGRHQKRRLS